MRHVICLAPGLPAGYGAQVWSTGVPRHASMMLVAASRYGEDAMVLRWVSGKNVVDDSTFLPGKRLILDAYRPVPVPESLQVYQVYSSAMRQVLKHIGIPERRPGSEFPAVKVDDDSYRSDRHWRLPEPRGWRKSAGFIFVANNSEATSGFIYSSRVGKAKLDTGTNVSVKDPIGTVPPGVGGRASLKVGFVFATDPDLKVEILTGEALAEHMISNLTTDVAPEDDPENKDISARVALQLPMLRDSLPHAYTPPSGWTITTMQQMVQGNEGDALTLDLDLETPTPGSGYLAVSFTDPADPERAETSDAWGITVDAELRISALTDPSELPLPLPAYA
jgi:hypothetical protein